MDGCYSKTELFLVLEKLDQLEKDSRKELSHDWVSPILSLEKCDSNKIDILQNAKNAPLSGPST